MGKHVHLLSNLNIENRTANCANCGQVSLKKAGAGWRCWKAVRAYRDLQEFPWRSHKKEVCELCGFIPVHICQLDVDHIDGNNSNNEESNLQTLCANCHRLKTHLNKDSHNEYGPLGAKYGYLGSKG
jgi:hypothetical protein